MTLLLISGSLREGSTNTALLRTAHAIDADSELFAGMGALPHFSPDDDHEPLDRLTQGFVASLCSLLLDERQDRLVEL